MVVVNINKKTFNLKFGLKVFKSLGTAWQTPSLSATLTRFAIFESMDTELTFAQIDIIVDLILFSIASSPENDSEISREEIENLFVSDTLSIMQTAQQVMQGLMASLPQTPVVEQGKPNAPAAKKRLSK